MKKIEIIIALLLMVAINDDCDFYHYYDNENTLRCTDSYVCPDGFSKLKHNTTECINDCSKDSNYKYEFKNECYEACPYPETELINDTCSVICNEEKPFEDLSTHECIETCDLFQIMMLKCTLKYQTNETLKLLEELLENFLNNLSPEFNNTPIEITPGMPITLNITPKIHDNPETQFNHRECISLLKKYYNIPENETISIFKIDNMDLGFEYEYYRADRTKLDHSICSNLQPKEESRASTDFKDLIHPEDVKCTIDKPFRNSLKGECSEICEPDDYMKGNCILTYQTDGKNDKLTIEEQNKIKNSILNQLDYVFTSEQYYNTYLNGLDSTDYERNFDNMKISFSSLESQMKNINSNKISINIGDCENILRAYYSLADKDKLYLETIEIFEEGRITPKIYYDIYGNITERNLIKLNKSLCEGCIILISIPGPPVEIPKEDKVNEKGSYKNFEITIDICKGEISNFPKIDISPPNKRILSGKDDEKICPDNCDYNYNYNIEAIECSCEIKTSNEDNNIAQNKDSNKDEIIYDQNIMNQIKIKKSLLNLGVLLCNVLKSKENIKKNIGFYILTSILGISLIISIIFISQGYGWFRNKIDAFIQKKFDNNNNNDNNNMDKPKNKNKKSKKKYKKNPPIRKNSKKLSSKKQKAKTPQLDPTKIDSQNLMMNKKSKRSLIIDTNINQQNEQNMNMMNNLQVNQNTLPLPPENDYEINWLSYNDALLYDKRSTCEYYFSLIKAKQLIIASFFSNNDYSSAIIKKQFFFSSFAFHYAINGFFFSGVTINKIYFLKEKFQFVYQIPQMLYSSLISMYIVRILAGGLASTNSDALAIKEQTNKNMAIYMKEKKLKCINIKIIFFFFLNLSFLGFFWYFLTSFNAIYKEAQIYLLETTLCSFAFTLFYPFIINVFPMMFRSCAINSSSKSNGCCYKFSQIIQLL